MQRARSIFRKAISKPHEEGSAHAPFSPRFRTGINVFGFILFISVSVILLLEPFKPFELKYFFKEFESVYSALFMCLMFGWIYGLDVKLWKRNNIPWTFTMQIAASHAASTSHVWTMCTFLTIVLSVCVTLTTAFTSYTWAHNLFPASIVPIVAFVVFDWIDVVEGLRRRSLITLS